MTGSDEHHIPNPNSNEGPSKREGKHPLEYFIAVFLVLTFIATSFAACYTRKQWITADDAEKRSLRAYLIAKNARFSRNKDGTLEYGRTREDGSRELLILYDVINEGITPAYHVAQQVGITEPFYHKVIEVTHRLGGAAYTSKEQTYTVRTTYFTDKQIADIATGNVELFFVGEITYDDIFGNSWPTKFCFLHTKRPVDPSFDYCSRDIDSGRWNYAR